MRVPHRCSTDLSIAWPTGINIRVRSFRESSEESRHSGPSRKWRISLEAHLTDLPRLRTMRSLRGAVSSAGRALLSHGRGHRFEPCTAHQPFPDSDPRPCLYI